jgi:hypothetical protein
VETRWEYILSWWAVAFFAVIYHAIRFLVVMIEDMMFLKKPSSTLATEQSPLIRENGSYTNYRQTLVENDVEGGCCSDAVHKKNDETVGEAMRDNVASQLLGLDSPWRKKYGLRLLHALLSGLNYGIALLLMLIAMTYNPGLLLALVFGYAVGDFLFFSKTRYSVNECH